MSKILCPGCQQATQINASGLMVDHSNGTSRCAFVGVMPGDASRGHTYEALAIEAEKVRAAIADLPNRVRQQGPPGVTS